MSKLDCEDGINEAWWDKEMMKLPPMDKELKRPLTKCEKCGERRRPSISWRLCAPCLEAYERGDLG